MLGRKGKWQVYVRCVFGADRRLLKGYNCPAGQWIFNQGQGGFLEEEGLLGAEEVRSAMGVRRVL